MRGQAGRTHGQTNTKIYKAWVNMIGRCYNANHPRFKDWGGRGIRVYYEWHNFIEFWKAIGEPPTSEHTIDRIDNNGNYEPGNVRWATRSEQMYNRRSTREIKLELRKNPIDKEDTKEYSNEQGSRGSDMNIPAFNFDVDLPSLREAMGLTHTEAKVLSILMQEEIASHLQLVEINSRIRQVMYSLRNKLKSKDIHIVNDRDIGYSIPLKYKLRIKNILEGEIADELDKAAGLQERLGNE